MFSKPGIALCTALSAVGLAACFAGGCTCLTGAAHWSYVYCKGGPEQITRWALAQSDDDRIFDATVTLLEMAGDADDARQSAEAIAGVERIHEKLLAGWPGYSGINSRSDADRHGPLSEERRAHNLDEQIRKSYDLMAIYRASGPSVRLFLKVRPDAARHPDRYSVWLRAGVESRVVQPDSQPRPEWARSPGT